MAYEDSLASQIRYPFGWKTSALAACVSKMAGKRRGAAQLVNAVERPPARIVDGAVRRPCDRVNPARLDQSGAMSGYETRERFQITRSARPRNIIDAEKNPVSRGSDERRALRVLVYAAENGAATYCNNPLTPALHLVRDRHLCRMSF